MIENVKLVVPRGTHDVEVRVLACGGATFGVITLFCRACDQPHRVPYQFLVLLFILAPSWQEV